MFQFLDGRKTHIQAALGALLVLARAFVGPEWYPLIDSALVVFGFGAASSLRAGVQKAGK